MLYKDSCNRKSNQQNLGTIKCSNLCTEIVEYSSPDEVICCTVVLSLAAVIILFGDICPNSESLSSLPATSGANTQTSFQLSVPWHYQSQTASSYITSHSCDVMEYIHSRPCSVRMNCLCLVSMYGKYGQNGYVPDSQYVTIVEH